MIVYVVIINGEVDSVFSNREAAENHLKNKVKKWSIGRIVEREVFDT